MALPMLLLIMPAAQTPNRAQVATRDLAATMRAGWLRSAEPSPGSHPLQFTIFLQQEGLDELSAKFRAVSDPDSPDYGQFLTKREVDEMVFALPEARATTKQWLASFGVVMLDEADSIVVSTTAATAAAMFGCDFHHYRHAKTGRTRVLAVGKLMVPAELRSHWHLVVGLTELWHGRDNRSRPHHDALRGRTSDDNDIKVTPAVLRTFYNIPDGEKNEAGGKNLQAIAAFNDYYDEKALSMFEAHFDEPAASVTAQGVDCLSNPKPCDEVESDLDVQYITAIGRGTPTLFFNANTTDAWVLGFTENAAKLSPLPAVFSLSYGWAELRQCDIAFEVCDTLGYDAKEYVARANSGLQKLAVMGASIMVSDGDDGAQSSSPDGADPIDPDRWCGGSEYTCYPKTKSKCAEVLLTNTSLSPPQSCPWPVGSLGELCEFLYLGDFFQDDDIATALKAANPDCGLELFYDFSYGVHLYSECACEALSPLSHKGVVSEPYKFNQSQRVFYADFPTASPYVTSVGATAFKSADGKTVSAEHAASIVDGAIITTGGGFSAVAAQPSWQKEAVAAWVSDAPSAAKPPAFMYDASMRGYPDVTLNGHNYQVFLKEKGNISMGGVDGTSASSPAFAGVVSLLNGHLLAAGKSTLGFLNPLLYKMAKEAPKAFRDVTYGDNKCTRNFCMLYGYNATVGWDPVAGLGSIDYAEMKAYVLAQKGVSGGAQQVEAA